MLIKLHGRLTIIEEIPYQHRRSEDDFDGEMIVTVQLHTAGEINVTSDGDKLPRAIASGLSERDSVKICLSDDKTLFDYGEVELTLAFVEDDE